MDTLTSSESGASAADTHTMVDLWHRRTTLNEIEIGQIYGMVCHSLKGYYPSELRRLPEDREELIAQFFYSRVLRLGLEQRVSHASAGSAPSTAYALCAYFRRFLIDCLRRASLQRDLSIEADGVQAELDARAHVPNDPVASALSEYGLKEPSVRESACAFIATLDEPDRIILAGSLGSAHKCKGGLKAVANANNVPSYHYRARKLGVTMKKDDTPDDFAATKVGCWIHDVLGIAIVPENSEVILIVLNLLALEA